VRITAAHADAVVMTTPQFDAEGLFGDDYLYFFAGHLEELFLDHARRDAAAAAGFTAVAGHGEDGQPLTTDSRRMIVVGRI
jgi:hypothetical protein